MTTCKCRESKERNLFFKKVAWKTHKCVQPCKLYLIQRLRGSPTLTSPQHWGSSLRPRLWHQHLPRFDMSMRPGFFEAFRRWKDCVLRKVPREEWQICFFFPKYPRKKGDLKIWGGTFRGYPYIFKIFHLFLERLFWAEIGCDRGLCIEAFRTCIFIYLSIYLSIYIYMSSYIMNYHLYNMRQRAQFGWIKRSNKVSDYLPTYLPTYLATYLPT